MDQEVFEHLEFWKNEIITSLVDENNIYIAIFNANLQLIYANKSIKDLVQVKGALSLINPSLPNKSENNDVLNLVYSGYITLGNYDTVNHSIKGKIYQRKNNYLIIGSKDSESLESQNHKLHELNYEVNNLHRSLINEKKKLNKILQELKDLNATKDKLFSIIAHDLRNPFSSILGFGQMLAENSENIPQEKVKIYSGFIYKSANEAYNLLENLLEWARIQTGVLKVNTTHVDLDEVVAEVYDLCNPTASKKDITLMYTNKRKYVFNADKEMIKTVLRNLVTNAIKFTPLNGLVKIDAVAENNDLKVIVSDNGVGMNQEQVDKLFKIENTTSTKGTSNESGTGLGLILCKEFIEKNNGTIGVQSESNKGSQFYFTVPLITNKSI